MTEAKIYVPTAVDGDTHDMVKRRMARRFGGYTAYDANGGWIDDGGNLVEESVMVYECVSPSTADGGETYSFFVELARDVEDASDEDAVLAYVGASADSSGETIMVE